MTKLAKEKWKKIQFPDGFVTDSNYQISNYGRVRNVLKCGAFHIKKPIFYEKQLIYRFTFPQSLNDGVRLRWHERASRLVAQHFSDEYFDGCYVVWEDYNRLNNYFRNLLCLEPSKGRSHVAKGIRKQVEQKLVVPPEDNTVETAQTHKVEIDDHYFKALPNFPNYEINRYGIVRRRKAPFVGRIIKQRLHPDQFYFVELIDANKKRRTVYIHKAVATVWNINLNPAENKVVVHLDGDTLNNVSDNLEWMSHSEALKLQFKHKKRDNRKSWKTRKKLYGNGFKNKPNKTKAKKAVVEKELEVVD